MGGGLQVIVGACILFQEQWEVIGEFIPSSVRLGWDPSPLLCLLWSRGSKEVASGKELESTEEILHVARIMPLSPLRQGIHPDVETAQV